MYKRKGVHICETYVIFFLVYVHFAIACYKGNGHSKNPWKDLFFWALLLDKRELAKFFWRKGKYPLGNGKTFL